MLSNPWQEHVRENQFILYRPVDVVAAFERYRDEVMAYTYLGQPYRMSVRTLMMEDVAFVTGETIIRRTWLKSFISYIQKFQKAGDESGNTKFLRTASIHRGGDEAGRTPAYNFTGLTGTDRVAVWERVVAGILFAGIAVIVFPVLVPVFVYLWATGNIFYSEERIVGIRNGILKTARIYKIRTMKDGEDGPGFARKEEPRVTKVGRFLRRAWLDEWPQFAQVALGQLHLFGQLRPRSLKMEEEVSPWATEKWKKLIETTGYRFGVITAAAKFSPKGAKEDGHSIYTNIFMMKLQPKGLTVEFMARQLIQWFKTATGRRLTVAGLKHVTYHYLPWISLILLGLFLYFEGTPSHAEWAGIFMGMGMNGPADREEGYKKKHVVFLQNHTAKDFKRFEAIDRLRFVPNDHKQSVQIYMDMILQMSGTVGTGQAHGDFNVLDLLFAKKLADVSRIDTPQKNTLFLEDIQQIYVPLAARIGLNGYADELSDEVFRIRHPKLYEDIKVQIADQLKTSYDNIPARVEDLRTSLEKEFAKDHLHDYDLVLRFKRPYSVYEKLKAPSKKYLTVKELGDLVSIYVVFDAKPGEKWSQVERRVTAAVFNAFENFLEANHLGQMAVFNPEIKDRTRGEYNHYNMGRYDSHRERLEGHPYEFQLRSRRVHREQKFGTLGEKGREAMWIYKTRRFFQSLGFRPVPHFEADTIATTIEDPQQRYEAILKKLSSKVNVIVFTEEGREKDRKVYYLRLSRDAIPADILSHRALDTKKKTSLLSADQYRALQEMDVRFGPQGIEEIRPLNGAIAWRNILRPGQLLYLNYAKKTGSLSEKAKEEILILAAELRTRIYLSQEKESAPNFEKAQKITRQTGENRLKAAGYQTKDKGIQRFLSETAVVLGLKNKEELYQALGSKFPDSATYLFNAEEIRPFTLDHGRAILKEALVRLDAKVELEDVLEKLPEFFSKYSSTIRVQTPEELLFKLGTGQITEQEISNRNLWPLAEVTRTSKGTLRKVKVLLNDRPGILRLIANIFKEEKVALSNVRTSINEEGEAVIEVEANMEDRGLWDGINDRLSDIVELPVTEHQERLAPNFKLSVAAGERYGLLADVLDLLDQYSVNIIHTEVSFKESLAFLVFGINLPPEALAPEALPELLKQKLEETSKGETDIEIIPVPQETSEKPATLPGNGSTVRSPLGASVIASVLTLKMAGLLTGTILFIAGAVILGMWLLKKFNIEKVLQESYDHTHMFTYLDVDRHIAGQIEVYPNGEQTKVLLSKPSGNVQAQLTFTPLEGGISQEARPLDIRPKSVRTDRSAAPAEDGNGRMRGNLYEVELSKAGSKFRLSALVGSGLSLRNYNRMLGGVDPVALEDIQAMENGGAGIQVNAAEYTIKTTQRNVQISFTKGPYARKNRVSMDSHTYAMTLIFPLDVSFYQENGDLYVDFSAYRQKKLTVEVRLYSDHQDVQFYALTELFTGRVLWHLLALRVKGLYYKLVKEPGRQASIDRQRKVFEKELFAAQYLTTKNSGILAGAPYYLTPFGGDTTIILRDMIGYFRPSVLIQQLRYLLTLVNTDNELTHEEDIRINSADPGQNERRYRADRMDTEFLLLDVVDAIERHSKNNHNMWFTKLYVKAQGKTQTPADVLTGVARHIIERALPKTFIGSKKEGEPRLTWRDAANSLLYGQYAGLINVLLVPMALKDIEKLNQVRYKGRPIVDLDAILFDLDLSQADYAALREAWQQVGAPFRRHVTKERWVDNIVHSLRWQIEQGTGGQQLVRAYLADAQKLWGTDFIFPTAEEGVDALLKAVRIYLDYHLPEEDIFYSAVALDKKGNPITIPDTDLITFATSSADVYTEASGAIYSTERLKESIRLLVMPVAFGGNATSYGFTLANVLPLDKEQDTVQAPIMQKDASGKPVPKNIRALFEDNYHGSVIWPWTNFKLLNGLLRNIAHRSKNGNGYSADAQWLYVFAEILAKDIGRLRERATQEILALTATPTGDLTVEKFVNHGGIRSTSLQEWNISGIPAQLNLKQWRRSVRRSGYLPAVGMSFHRLQRALRDPLQVAQLRQRILREWVLADTGPAPPAPTKTSKKNTREVSSVNGGLTFQELPVSSGRLPWQVLTRGLISFKPAALFTLFLLLLGTATPAHAAEAAQTYTYYKDWILGIGAVILGPVLIAVANSRLKRHTFSPYRRHVLRHLGLAALGGALVWEGTPRLFRALRGQPKEVVFTGAEHEALQFAGALYRLDPLLIAAFIMEEQEHLSQESNIDWLAEHIVEHFSTETEMGTLGLGQVDVAFFVTERRARNFLTDLYNYRSRILEILWKDEEQREAFEEFVRRHHAYPEYIDQSIIANILRKNIINILATAFIIREKADVLAALDGKDMNPSDLTSKDGLIPNTAILKKHSARWAVKGRIAIPDPAKASQDAEVQRKLKAYHKWYGNVYPWDFLYFLVAKNYSGVKTAFYRAYRKTEIYHQLLAKQPAFSQFMTKGTTVLSMLVLLFGGLSGWVPSAHAAAVTPQAASGTFALTGVLGHLLIVGGVLGFLFGIGWLGFYIFAIQRGIPVASPATLFQALRLTKLFKFTKQTVTAIFTGLLGVSALIVILALCPVSVLIEIHNKQITPKIARLKEKLAAWKTRFRPQEATGPSAVILKTPYAPVDLEESIEKNKRTATPAEEGKLSARLLGIVGIGVLALLLSSSAHAAEAAGMQPAVLISTGAVALVGLIILTLIFNPLEIFVYAKDIFELVSGRRNKVASERKKAETALVQEVEKEEKEIHGAIEKGKKEIGPYLDRLLVNPPDVSKLPEAEEIGKGPSETVEEKIERTKRIHANKDRAREAAGKFLKTAFTAALEAVRLRQEPLEVQMALDIYVMDRIFAQVHQFAIRRFGQDRAGKIALVAVGGYGRGDYIYGISDFDGRLIWEKEDLEVADFMNQILEGTGDISLFYGLAHTLKRPGDLPWKVTGLEQVQETTSALEARFVGGDRSLWQKWFRELVEAVYVNGHHFIESKVKEFEEQNPPQRHRKERNRKEPNVKKGLGGLRSLQALLAVGKVGYIHWFVEHTSEEKRTVFY